ncbi:unnamed protein product [Enterobius vermicularis]|uniref:THUMP domain-containing protein n=1 Tax=Enterobius vermicularis TaxID=51028 RepID=A0A0N4UWP1_ENTVE|nr:unnamed protein product [Enterobius vermicularis]
MLHCVTVGKGLEDFVIQQLKMFSVGISSNRYGKIVFETQRNRSLLDLKCVERLFAVIAYKTITRPNFNKRDLFNLLFICLNGEAIFSSLENLNYYSDATGAEVNWRLRVSLKVTGKWKRKIDIPKLSTTIARFLRRSSQLHLDPRNSNCEICVHISDSDLFIGIPIRRLSCRYYLLGNALRSTVVDAMIMVAEPRESQLIFDFTTGSSSVILETAHLLKNKCFSIGSDIEWKALETSLENRGHLEVSDKSACLIDFICVDIEYGDHYFFVIFNNYA